MLSEPMTPIDHAQAFLEGQPTPAAIAWVRQSLASLVESDFCTVSKAFGIDGQFQAKYRHSQWLRHIEQAVAIIKADGRTSYSIAREISSEIRRQKRSHRHPVSDFERHIAAALAVNPDGADSPDALRKHIRQMMEALPGT